MKSVAVVPIALEGQETSNAYDIGDIGPTLVSFPDPLHAVYYFASIFCDSSPSSQNPHDGANTLITSPSSLILGNNLETGVGKRTTKVKPPMTIIDL